jgi:hypothetical protein
MPDPELDVARRQLGISYVELWLDYFALGGALDAQGLTRYLRGDRPASVTDHNTIVQALNEMFSARGQDSPIVYRTR